MTARKKAVAKKAETLPAEVLADLSGSMGLEEADRDSFAIPFLKILQKMSPEADRDDDAYVEGAEAGKFYFPTTNELFDEVIVIPVHFRRVFLEWKTRDSGGGFVAEYGADVGVQMLAECNRDDKNRDILPNGHELQDTRVHYIMVVTQDGMFPAVFSCARTQVKGSKDWMNRIANRKLPNGSPANSFAQVFTFSVVKRSNDQGSWYVFKATPRMAPTGLITDFGDHWSAAKDDALSFRDMIISGATSVKFEDLATEKEVEGTQEF